MALYVQQHAKLGDIEGTGYLFREQSASGETYRGVFFGDGEGEESLESLVDDKAVPFTGVLYKKTLSGKISKTDVELPVDVLGYQKVSMGDKVMLEVSED